MSYVAALRFPEFIVMSADTLESWNDEVCYEEKIEIERTHSLDIVVGGAGRGELCEAFAAHVFESIRRIQPTTEKQIEFVLSDVLISFYENDVRLFPSRSKATAFVIAVREASGELYVWKTSGMRLKAVPRFASVGRAHPFVQNMMHRLYKTGMTANQAVLLAIHIIALAKTGSRIVGGPPQVVFISKAGVFPETEGYIAELNRRFKKLLPFVDGLILSMPDLTLPDAVFNRALKEMSAQVSEIRGEYKQEFAERSFTEGINWPYAKLPAGSVMFESSDGSGRRTMFAYSDPDDPERETMALRLDDDGVLRFKITTNIFIDEKTYEHLRSCPSVDLKDCIQHIGQDG